MTNIRFLIIFIISLMLGTGQALAKSAPPGTSSGDIPANVLIMLDTSGSMGSIISSGDSRYPMDITFDSAGNYYVAKYYDVIEKYDSSGNYLLQWGGYDGTDADGKFDYTYAIDVDSSDNIYVADRNHGRIQKFNNQGVFLSKMELSGNRAYGLAIDSSDNVYAVNSSGQVEKFNTSGTRVATWSTTNVLHIAIDGSDNVFVAKYNDYQVERYDTDGNLQSSFSLSFRPLGIAADTSGDLYITDYSNSRVYKYSSTGSYIAQWGGYGSTAGYFKNPRGIAQSPSGDVYAADYYNHRIQSNTGTIPLVNGTPQTRLDQAKDVIKQIVSNSDLTEGANFGLMEWNSSANMLVNVSDTGAASIFSTIDSLNDGGGTYLDNAMDLANSYFTGSSSPMISGATCQQNLLIVISDGFWVDNTASATAESLFNTYDIKTFTVGFQTTGNSNYVTLSQKGGTYPDSPLYADNADHLYEILESYIRSIISAQLAFASPTIMPGVSTSDYILQSTFTYRGTHQWKGRLLKYNLLDNGDIGTLQWDAGELLNNVAAADRNLWTVSPGLTTGLDNFTTSNLERLRQPMEEDSGLSYTDDELNSLINFVRGVDSYSEYPTGVDEDNDTLMTGERWKLADIYHAAAVVMGPPSEFFSDEANVNSLSYYRYLNNYKAFRDNNTSRKEVIFAASNGGMVHAFDSSTGAELWGFIPPSVLSNFKDMISSTSGQSNSIYAVDGTPTVKDVYYGGSWKTILIGGLRQGGHSYYALDVTDPDNPAHLFTFEFTPSKNRISYWAADGARTDHYTTGTVTAGYDFSRLGEAWSRPIIELIDDGLGTYRWHAIIGGGFNSGVNPNYAANVFLLNLEDGGTISQEITLADNNSSNGIVNAVPPLITSISADSTTSFTDTGALLYVSDLEGKLWKVNLTGTGVLYETTKLFNAESTSTNGRLSFHPLASAIESSTDTLMHFYGTGDQQRLDLVDTNIANRIFAIQEADYPNFSSTIEFTDTSLKNATPLGASCPTDSQKGWYINLDSHEKVTAEASIKSGIVFMSRYTPDTANVCGAGTGKITEHSLSCGTVEGEHDLGVGIPTRAVVYKNKMYIGVSDDSATALPSGFTKVGNLIVGVPSNLTTGTVKVESWWESFF